MSIFDNYENNTSIPENCFPPIQYKKLDITNTPPREMYNVKHQFVGLSWAHGEQFAMKFNSFTNVDVALDSIIYSEPNQKPNDITEGYVGQHAYNTADCKSWVCTDIVDGVYFWREDIDGIVVEKDGLKEVIFQPDLTGKLLRLTIYNFRWEEVYKSEDIDGKSIELIIDEDMTKILVPGVYYAILEAVNEHSVERLTKTLLAIS